MRVVLQRAKNAQVTVNQDITGSIDFGLVILAGFEDNDQDEDLQWITKKILNLRIFNDDAGIMNKSVLDVQGSLLVISQFTLHASTKKGNRPSYIKAAKASISEPLFKKFVKHLEESSDTNVQTGIFGADMQVQLVNDGPVTIIIDSKNKDL